MDADLPLAEPPDGVDTDFRNLAPLQVAIIISGAITLFFALLLLMTRLYTSIYLVKKPGWDLLLITLAWLAALGLFVAVAGRIRDGLGQHYWNVTVSQVSPYMSKVVLTAVMYIWPLTLAKLSLLVVYHQINPEMVFKYCVYVVALVVLTPTVVYTSLMIGPCNPRTNPDRIQCIHDLGVMQATTNIGTDLILIAMPLYMVRGLNVSRKKKIVVACLMGFGSSVIAVSIPRTCFLQAFVHDPDFTYHHGVLILMSLLEVNFGVACACLPLLQPFLKRYLPRLALKISDTARDNERDNKRRNHRALQRGGVIIADLSIITTGARFSPRRWRMGLEGGDGARRGYALHSVGKDVGTKDSIVSVETRSSLEAVITEHEHVVSHQRL